MTTTPTNKSHDLVRCDNCGRYGWHETDRCPERPSSATDPQLGSVAEDFAAPDGDAEDCAVRAALIGLAGLRAHLWRRRLADPAQYRKRFGAGIGGLEVELLRAIDVVEQIRDEFADEREVADQLIGSHGQDVHDFATPDYRTPVERKAAEAVQMCQCHFCGADEGEECHVRPAGKPLKWPHQRRMRAYHHRCKSHTDVPDRAEGRPADATPTMYGAPIDVIAEGVLRDDALREMDQLMEGLRPKHLTALEILAMVAILRGAAVRIDAQQLPAAAVLKLMPGRRSSPAKRRSAR